MREPETKKPTIAVEILFWKRPRVTNFVFNYFHKQKKRLASQLTLEIITVGSEGNCSRVLAEKYGFHYLEFKNNPLNLKAIAGCRYARQFNPDAFVVCGSNDVISDDYYLRMLNKIKTQKLHAAGILDSYIYDIHSRRLKYWPGYQHQSRRTEPLGLARMFSHTLMNDVQWTLWDKNKPINRSLDMQCRKKLLHLGYQLQGFRMGEVGYTLQIKTGSDMTSMTVLNRLTKDVSVHKVKILRKFNYSEADIRRALKK